MQGAVCPGFRRRLRSLRREKFSRLSLRRGTLHPSASGKASWLLSKAGIRRLPAPTKQGPAPFDEAKGAASVGSAHRPHRRPDPPEFTQTPAELTRDPPEFTQTPMELTRDPPEFTQTQAELTRDPPEFTQTPAELARDPPELSKLRRS